MMKYVNYAILLSACIAIGCKTVQPILPEVRDSEEIDYSNLQFWAAHPDKLDEADRIGGSNQVSDQSNLKADVFFVYPTIFTDRKAIGWNANVSDPKLNEEIDKSTIKFQASIFNTAGKVYAPRYRQAHLRAYYTSDKKNASEAFDMAYADVRNAFEYYLENHNNGRPIIVASHSQGTTHCIRLVEDYFDGTSLQDQLVAAYLIGIPVEKDQYTHISPCTSADQTGCTISWRTWRRGHKPSYGSLGNDILVTNPLSWTTDSEYVDKEENKGGILRNFKKVRNKLADAQIEGDILWTNKPKFPFSFLFTRKNYHIADLNLYYNNIRENSERRVEAFTGG